MCEGDITLRCHLLFVRLGTYSFFSWESESNLPDSSPFFFLIHLPLRKPVPLHVQANLGHREWVTLYHILGEKEIMSIRGYLLSTPPEGRRPGCGLFLGGTGVLKWPVSHLLWLCQGQWPGWRTSLLPPTLKVTNELWTGVTELLPWLPKPMDYKSLSH